MLTSVLRVFLQFVPFKHQYFGKVWINRWRSLWQRASLHPWTPLFGSPGIHNNNKPAPLSHWAWFCSSVSLHRPSWNFGLGSCFGAIHRLSWSDPWVIKSAHCQCPFPPCTNTRDIGAEDREEPRMACLPLGHLTDDDPEPVARRSSAPVAARKKGYFEETYDAQPWMAASGNIFTQWSYRGIFRVILYTLLKSELFIVKAEQLEIKICLPLNFWAGEFSVVNWNVSHGRFRF